MIDLRPGDMAEPTVVPVSPGGRHFGEWLATVRFRPPEAGRRLRVVQRYGSTARDALANVLTAVDELRGGEISSLTVDGARSREYIAAAGHLHELQGALKALDLASASTDDDVRRFLRAHAVTLHGRTFKSDVRMDLKEYVEFDQADLEFRDRLRVLRNKSVAHSENSMTVTFPMIALRRSDADVGNVEIAKVWAMTVEAGMPAPFEVEFRAFLERAVTHLTAALRDLRGGVRQEPTPEQLVTLFNRPKQAQFSQRPVDDWTPNNRRAPFPKNTIIEHYGASGDDVSYTVHIEM